MSDPDHILVAGAGLGGLTAALALARKGKHVTVFERSPELTEVGAGIQIAPNGTHVLGALGLDNDLSAIGFRPQAATLRLGRSGHIVFSNPLGKTARQRYGADYYHVHRADLHRVLSEALANEPAASLQLGTGVQSFSEKGEHVTVALSDGATVDGNALIGADGIHSAVRAGLFGDDAPRFTGNAAWRLLVPADRLPPGLIPPDATVWTGEKGHAVTYFVRGGELVNFVGVVERADWQVESWLEQGDLGELRRDFAPWCDTIQTLLGAADPESCFKWALYDRDPMPQWSKGRVTLLGDACHPMLPFMAQGACMAMEDAWVLARHVEQAADISRAFSAYENARRKRTARVQLAARANAVRFHKGRLPGQLLTYGPMWIAAQLAPSLLNRPFDWIYAADVTRERA